jgi:hypothetical protein
MKVGDKVVCIRTHSQWVVKKGQIYTIYDVYKCRCGVINFDVGIKAAGGLYHCTICNHTSPNNGVHWIDSRNFAPLQYNSAMDKILSEVAEERIDVPEKELA